MLFAASGVMQCQGCKPSLRQGHDAFATSGGLSQGEAAKVAPLKGCAMQHVKNVLSKAHALHMYVARHGVGGKRGGGGRGRHSSTGHANGKQLRGHCFREQLQTRVAGDQTLAGGMKAARCLGAAGSRRSPGPENWEAHGWQAMWREPAADQ